MASINKAVPKNFTHEGAPAKNTTVYQGLRRAIAACLLWEDQFYEDGEDIAKRISFLASHVTQEQLSALAIEARTDMKLRHAPLWLARELARGKGKIVGDTLYEVIQRPDELTEFLALYWKDKRQPLSKQVKLGLGRAFTKFDAYQLAKYDRSGVVKLRDVLFLTHAKPKNDDQAKIWRKLVDKTLESPDTWEVALSSGVSKNETFTRLLSENKLGYLALLRNLRNMKEAGVNERLVSAALMKGAKNSRALPFRFVAAARACPGWEHHIDKAMQLSLGNMPRLEGHTTILVDISGSMDWGNVSKKSELTRKDAACALAVLIAGISEQFTVLAFESNVHAVPSRQGFGLIDAINRLPSGGTDLGRAVHVANQQGYDRLIVITDEQSHTRVPDPVGKGYIINVASYQNGVGYGAWTHIDGFSENVIKWVQEYESL